MLVLRHYTDSDACVITQWLKNEYAFRQWSADRYESYPITAEDMGSYYTQYSDEDLCKLTAVDENGIIGHLTIRFIDDERKIARLGFVIVDDTKRGQGYGKLLSPIQSLKRQCRLNEKHQNLLHLRLIKLIRLKRVTACGI